MPQKTALQETIEQLEAGRAKSDEALVFYSDGKESRCIAGLAKRTFKRCVGVFMEFIPNLRCVDQALAEAEARFDWKIIRYPHWLISKSIRGGIYCDPWHGLDDVPEWKLSDIYALAMHQTGIRMIVTGAKRKDSRWRARMLKTWGKRADTIYPLIGWSLPDVLAYLNDQKIPRPPSSKGTATGIDLSTPSVLWLHDTYPDDFERLCVYFPYARAVVERRRMHGIAA